jgi:putative phosphoesterase
MKIALISDLHGNIPALNAVLADAGDADRIICLGDIVDLGPEPGAAIAVLRERGIDCLKGNHDPFELGPIEPAAVWAWTLAQLSADELDWLRELPPSLEYEFEGVRLLCVHGSPRSFDEQVLATTSDDALREMVAGRVFDVMACGHTHVQLLRKLDGHWIVNPGSVAMPFVEPLLDPRPPQILPWAEYATLTLEGGNVQIDLHKVDYDIEDYFARVRQSSMPDPDGWVRAWVSR